jgi:hypothetical protein
MQGSPHRPDTQASPTAPKVHVTKIEKVQSKPVPPEVVLASEMPKVQVVVQAAAGKTAEESKQMPVAAQVETPPTAPQVKRTFQTTSKSRTATPAMRRYLIKRDEGCVYEHNGKKCGSRHMLEVDHIMPFAYGGKTEIENLRVLCRAHNQLRR